METNGPLRIVMFRPGGHFECMKHFFNERKTTRMMSGTRPMKLFVCTWIHS